MTEGTFAVLDWRRRVHGLYEDVRAGSDPEAAHAAWVAGRDDLLRTHAASPVPRAHRAAYPGAAMARYDASWRFVARVEPAGPERLEVETGTDGVVPFERVGTVRLGDIGTLDVWWLASYGGGLFIPLRDTSAGTPGGTYGGGRYLIDTVKGADLGGGADGLVLDLNFAYNPSCFYDEAWACPLPQAGNRLAVTVPVGELA